MIISLIVAMSKNRVIGNKQGIPWSIPEDMLYFQTMTHNCPVIMGRKTHESIGMWLPNRKNIVISRNENYVPRANCFKASSIEEAIKKVENKSEIFIIGGSDIYTFALPLAKRIYLTSIDSNIDGDTTFPAFEYNHEWTLVIDKPGVVSPNKAGLNYRFLVYEKDHDTDESDLVDTYMRRYNSLISKIS
jgi:dihydrofolate reductase